MAVAFDQSNAGVSVSSTTASFTFSGVTSSNPVILVGVGISGTSDNVTGVTANGVSMTLVAKTPDALVGYFHYLFQITGQSGDVAIVASVSPSNAGLQASAVSYSGVSQSAPIAQSATQTDTTTSVSQSMTAINGSTFFPLFMIAAFAASATAGTNTQKRLNAASTNAFWFDNTNTVSAGGTATLNITLVGADSSNIMAELAPFVATTASSLLAILGVG